MNATPALTTATANPPAAAAVPQGTAAAPAEGEVLSVSELLRLLEQGAGFTQALAHAAAPLTAPLAEPPASAAAAPDGRMAPADAGSDPQGHDEAPCDIATLIRLLEQQGPSPAQSAMAAALAAAGALPSLPATLAGAPAATPGSTSGGRTVAAPATAAAPAATDQPPPAADRATAEDAGLAALLAVTDSAPTPDAAADGRGADRASAGLHSSATPAADPAQVTLNLAQSFRSEMPASPPVERVVHVPVRDPAWPQAVAAEIQFLAGQRVEAATLRLSPEHLGPLEVRIDVRDGNISVSFGVTHGDTQAALEQALPRLREMFAAAGLNLGQASVQQETRRGSHNGGAAPASGASATDNGDGAAPGRVRAVGLVDEYA
jgi:flagellar hook-length control protein FliK